MMFQFAKYPNMSCGVSCCLIAPAFEIPPLLPTADCGKEHQETENQWPSYDADVSSKW